MSSVQPVAIQSYPERFVGWIPLPGWLCIFFFWEVILAVDYFLGAAVQGPTHLAEFAFLGIFFALVGCSTIYCSRVLVRLHDDLFPFIEDRANTFTGWYQQQLQRSYRGWWPLMFGGAFALLESFTAGPVIRQFTPPGNLSLFRAAYEFIGFFFLGMGVWALVNVARIPISMMKYKVRVSLTQRSGRGLQALGTSYFRMSLAIIATFVPLVVALVISPLGSNLFILVWLIAGMLLIFSFFLLPQVGIHRIMASEKDYRLTEFNAHLEEAMEHSLKDPSAENTKRLKDLFEVQGHLNEMNEWPFNINLLWQLITALLIPVALALMDRFF